MCSGRVHTIINFTAIAIATPLLCMTSSLSYVSIFTAAASAAFGTIFLSPDLDLKQSRSTRAWGPLSWLWAGYNRLFRHRRSSHAVFVGTIGRLFYLLVVALVFAVTYEIVRYPFESLDRQAVDRSFRAVWSLGASLTPWLEEHAGFGCAFLMGLTAADSLHIGADLLYSWCRRHLLFRG